VQLQYTCANRLSPVFGPLIGGFTTQYKGWRWANWVVMIAGGAAFIMMCLIQETYKPRLLQQMAKKKRKETGEDKWWSRYDVRVGFGELMRVNLSRPFVMAIKEPICVFWNVYIAIIYGKQGFIVEGIDCTDYSQVSYTYASWHTR
jgi:MFS family permease